ncbi:MAG: winged helix-turn-helix transcriptional regulator [Butyricicoccus sp.]
MTSKTTCPVETTLRLIGNRWKILIIRDLMGGTRRFGELKKSVGEITQKVLTSNLREMEADGLVTRTAYAEMPPRVEYTLTEAGRSLRPIIEAMTRWGEEYQRSHAAAHATHTE